MQTNSSQQNADFHSFLQFLSSEDFSQSSYLLAQRYFYHNQKSSQTSTQTDTQNDDCNLQSLTSGEDKNSDFFRSILVDLMHINPERGSKLITQGILIGSNFIFLASSDKITIEDYKIQIHTPQEEADLIGIKSLLNFESFWIIEVEKPIGLDMGWLGIELLSGMNLKQETELSHRVEFIPGSGFIANNLLVVFLAKSSFDKDSKIILELLSQEQNETDALSIILNLETLEDSFLTQVGDFFEKIPEKIDSFNLNIEGFSSYREYDMENYQALLIKFVKGIAKKFKFAKKPRFYYAIMTYELWIEGLFSFQRSNASSLYTENQDFDSALDLSPLHMLKSEQYDQVISYYQTLKTDDPISTNLIAMNLGKIYYLIDKDREAMFVELKVAEQIASILGEQHMFSAILKDNIASLSYSLGDNKKSISYYLDAIRAKERLVEENHHCLLLIYCNIAEVYFDEEKKIEGQNYLNKALKIVEKYPESLIATFAYGKLGFKLSQEEKHALSLESHKKSLEIRRKILGTELHSFVGDSHFNIAREYRALSDYKSALENCDKAYQIYLKIFGCECKSIADVYHSLGMIYSDDKMNDKSIESYKKAVEMKILLYGNKIRDLGDTYFNLALVYEEQENFDEALAYYTKSQEVYELNLGHYHKDVHDVIRSIGLLKLEAGQYEEAIMNCGKAMEIAYRLYGEESEYVSRLYRDIGQIYYKKGMYKVAILNFNDLKKGGKLRRIHLNTSIDIDERLFGKVKDSISISYFYLGIVYTKLNDYKKSKKSYKQALDIKLKLHGFKDITVGNTIYNLAIVTKKLFMHSTSAKFYQKALTIYKDHYGADHEECATTKHHLTNETNLEDRLTINVPEI